MIRSPDAPDPGLQGELMIGELMGTLGMSWEEVQKLGYFAACRLRTIAIEMNAASDDRLSILLDRPHADKDYRDSITDWIKKRQTRSYPTHGKLPKEIQDRLMRKFNG